MHHELSQGCLQTLSHITSKEPSYRFVSMVCLICLRARTNDWRTSRLLSRECCCRDRCRVSERTEHPGIAAQAFSNSGAHNTNLEHRWPHILRQPARSRRELELVRSSAGPK